MLSSSLDQRFLENLKQRLNINNRRSIYLNAWPGRYLTRLDGAALNLIEEGLAQQFIEQLLSNPNASLDIKVAPEKAAEKEVQQLLRRLSSMMIENKDHFEEHGVHTFGFGYPILIRRDHADPSKIIKAPLFIWTLELKRNWKKANEWVLSRNEDAAVVSNISLAAHLQKDIQIQLTPLYDHLMDDGLLDKDELSALLYKQYEQLVFEADAALRDAIKKALAENMVVPFPNRDFIQQMPLEKPVILWSGLFGLYRSQKESIAKDIEQFEEQLDDFKTTLEQLEQQQAAQPTNFMKHTFSIVDTDPSQQHLLHALGRGQNLIIQGPPGTGKSQTLTGILSNAVSNGARCLVVCEKKTALDVLFANLEELGLGELAIVVEDVYRDRRPLVASVRERLKHKHGAYKPSPNFIRVLKSCALQIKRLQKYHEKLIQPLCGEANWQEVVADFLEAEAAFPRKKIEQQLNSKSFKFTPDEFELVNRTLHEGEPLFRELGSLQHPFNAFHERFFKIPNTHQVSTELKKSVEDLLYVLDAAQRDLLAYLYQYEKMMEEHYSMVLAKKGNLSDEVIDMIENGLKASKYFFNKNKGAYRNFLTKVSKKHRKMKEDKLTILKNYTLLRNFHERYSYFNHDFIDISNISAVTFESILKNTETYKEGLGNWYQEKENVIREYVNQLKVGYVHPHVDFKKQTKEISRNLDLFAQNFVKSKVFKVPFGFKSDVIRERLNSLEELDENLKKLNANFENDFAAYHPLKYFWLTLNPAQQAAFQGLANSNVDNWLSYFKSWYLHHLLNAHADEYVPQESHYHNIVNNFQKEEAEMRRGLIDHSLRYWRSKQAEAVNRFNKEKAPLKVHGIYNLRGNSGGRRTPLRQLFEADPELFSSFFPILMVNPSVCASMLPLKPQLFDLVIFDEASQLRLEDTFAALMRGQFKVISGDSQQMPPSDYFQSTKSLVVSENDETIEDPESWALENEAINYLSSSESLLEYSIADGTYKEEFLEVHYRSRHPYLIDFSNAAFYGKRLTPMPEKQAYVPISFKTVNGVYHQGINALEADEIIDELLTIAQAVEDRNFPSVGVACFNIHQRNYILERIQQKRIENTTTAGLFEALFNAGLFVKNLENIQGDERDIMLLSTTFGPKEDGSFLQNFGPINRQQGYRLLNVIITRAKKELKVFCSIPFKYYSQYRTQIEENGNNGKAIFYAYLNYAKAVSEGDEISRSSILELLFKHCVYKPMFSINMSRDNYNSFEKQVFEYIESHAGDLTLTKNARIAGFPIPLLISNADGQPIIGLYFDVFHEYYSEEAYAWDFFRDTHLSKMNIRLLRVWSYSWWQNNAAEKSRILAFIKQHTKTEE